MRFTKVLMITGLLFWVSTLQASQDGEKLFETKCMSCHTKMRPSDTSKLIAPPIMGALRHVKDRYPMQKEAVDFIVSYVLNPQRDKALCMPQNIDKFGLMPSQKGNVSKEELETIAKWLYKNFPPSNFKPSMMHKQGKSYTKQKSKSCTNPSKQSKNKMKQNNKKISPFLISKGLPHLTKLVKMHWNDLNLSDKQKSRLLVVRKDTVSGVRSIAPKVMKIEKKIKQMILNGENPEGIYPYIDKLSKLKADATKVHARCIYNTKKILSNQQLKYLLQK